MRPSLRNVAEAGQALRVWRLGLMGMQTLSISSSFDTHVTVTQDTHLAGTGLLSGTLWGQSPHPVHAWAGPGSMMLYLPGPARPILGVRPVGPVELCTAEPCAWSWGAVSLSQQRPAETAQVQGAVRTLKANLEDTDL